MKYRKKFLWFIPVFPGTAIITASLSPELEGRAYCEYLGQNSFSTVPGTDYQFH